VSGISTAEFPTMGCLEKAVEAAAAAVAAVVASSGPHHPCVAGNLLPFWVLVWQRHAPPKRSSDSGVGTGQDPTLSNARCRGILQKRRFGNQSVEVVESILIVGSDKENGNGIQILTIGGEPYNGMQCAYGSSVTSKWS
jgi:hypothetical protein